MTLARDIKICGLRTLEALDAALVNGANQIGFVFFPMSPRNISVPLAAALCDGIDARARVVAVTVNADDRLLDEIVAQVRPDLLQLHGSETPCRVTDIKKRYKLPVVKAISVHSRPDLQNIVPYYNIADRLLFDAKAPKGAARPGGHGIPFDWHILDGLNKSADYMLSGGLRVDNVAEALAITRAGGIDISSGVERVPGVKDVCLIKAFLEVVVNICQAATVK
ncbi:MAG: phosphoribosylanthranilate isomerase [Candidatus Tokpelaia sp. JSC085]|nr:MAG: phosphoribosylanthranilate isomerase [Candidatus Tokpelaia sp. JSC085]